MFCWSAAQFCMFLNVAPSGHANFPIRKLQVRASAAGAAKQLSRQLGACLHGGQTMTTANIHLITIQN